jgi:hypothetical protein
MLSRRCLTLLAFAAAANAQSPLSIRVLLGTTDRESTTWDGSVTAQGAAIVSIEPWRFEGTDSIAGNAFRVSTHPMRRFAGANANDQPPVVPNGLVITLSSDAPTTLQFTTAPGKFELRTDEIGYGRSVTKLDGKVFADRIPPTTRITQTPGEEDYPSAAVDRDGNVWIAYILFRHHPQHFEMTRPLSDPMTSFGQLAEASGGDQIVLRKFSGGAWGAPIEITAAGLDLYRPAIAIDGRGRPWVFWSQNDRGNFDLYARPVANGRPGAVVRLSTEPGSDIDPAAAADSGGNVWVAWQGWRNGHAAIFAATQRGDRFSTAEVVSRSAGNEWDPAIAASRDGRVTVAWDSYRNGNYDIFARTASAGRWGAEMPVAATARYEAYPSMAYDRAGRLWVAYEEGGAGWGKDFGAYDTHGIALYQGRAIRLVGLDAGGGRLETGADLGAALPGFPSPRIEEPGAQSESEDMDPNPATAANRRPPAAAANKRSARNNYPRLTIDEGGRFWLAFRSSYPTWWTPPGTVWTEHLVSYDGGQWSSPIYLHHSDNLLDNRPAIVSAKAGTALIIGSADNRRAFHPAPARALPADAKAPAQKKQAAIMAAGDPYNNDLFASEITLGPITREIAVKPAAARNIPSGPDPAAETAAIKRLRDYRADAGPLRIVRGEFHRHSEISMDGGSDGSLLDQWRYILDTGALDWVGCCDHDNGNGREYTWWIEQKLTDIFYSPGVFVPMFAYERSVAYPEGHRNVIFAQRGIRPLPRLPLSSPDAVAPAPDTQMLYAYLKHFDGIVASHTSATTMGTDWRDNDPRVEPVVEIYQGDRQNYEMPGAPRASSENDSIGGWRPKGFVNLALEKGYVFAFEASSDHVSTHISYCNIYVKDLTRASVLEALKLRHVYAATDNILADVRSGDHMMGDVFTTSSAPSLRVKLSGTARFTKVHVIKDNQYVYSPEPNSSEVSFSWMDNSATPGKTSYYYVRGEQEDGQIVWASPLWITYKP